MRLFAGVYCVEFSGGTARFYGVIVCVRVYSCVSCVRVLMCFYVAVRCILLQNTLVKLVSFEWFGRSRKHTIQPNALGSPSNFHASSASDVDTLRSSFSMSASSVFLLTHKHTIGCIRTVRVKPNCPHDASLYRARVP